MDVKMPKPGKYVIAVSGGVDSMVLLDVLSRESNLQLVVAHLDHGIRVDSHADKELVRLFTNKLGLDFESKLLNLGSEASEDTARKARYDFLYDIQKKYQADGIITAHHQDDLIETAILNMLRGTGRKGLSSLSDNPDIIRPLLNTSKQAIIDYAEKHNIKWHEDSTNQEDKYLRNYVRLKIIPKMAKSQKDAMLKSISTGSEANREIDTLLVKQLQINRYKSGISRAWFNGLPHVVATETMASWLRLNQLRDFDRKTIDRLVIASKTSKNNKKQPIIKGANLLITKDELALELVER